MFDPPAHLPVATGCPAINNWPNEPVPDEDTFDPVKCVTDSEVMLADGINDPVITFVIAAEGIV